jgi:N utilization substance protein B
MKMTRSEQREQAFALVFERIFNEETIEGMVDHAAEARDLTVGAYARKAAQGVQDHLEDIDAAIEKYTVGWQKKRISKVSLAILRLAVYEMKYEDDVPVRVAINEAVELAKKYATQEDASFVNGLLGSVARNQEGAK